MGKATGFLEFQRETPAERDPLERVKDYEEFHLHMTDTKLQQQGARCMDCGIPFCHTGQLINGMAADGMTLSIAGCGARRWIACTRPTTSLNLRVVSVRLPAKARARWA